MAGVNVSEFFTQYASEHVTDAPDWTVSETYVSEFFITYGTPQLSDAADGAQDVLVDQWFVQYATPKADDLAIGETYLGVQLAELFVTYAFAVAPYKNGERGYVGEDEMIFTDIIFPQCIVYGSSMSPRYLTDKLEVQSGAEQRNSRHEYPKHVYRILLENLNAKEMSDIVRLYHAVSGDFTGFLLVDPLDNTSADDQTGYYSAQTIAGYDQLVALGDGVTNTWNLYKYYTHESRQKRRRIRHPNPASLIVFVDSKDMTVNFLWNVGLQQLQYVPRVGNFTVSVSMVGQKITGFDATAYAFDVNDLIWATGWPVYNISTHLWDNNTYLSGDPLRIIGIDNTGLTVERYDGSTTNFGNEGPFDITIRHAPTIPSGKLITSGYEFWTPVRFDEAAMEIEPKAGLRNNIIATLDSVVLRELFE